jgi:hypothetical protein
MYLVEGWHCGPGRLAQNLPERSLRGGTKLA